MPQNPIIRPVLPNSDKTEVSDQATVILLYIIELLEAIAISQGIELVDPD